MLQNGLVDEQEFEVMAYQVVRIAGIFTGAEAGRSCVDTLTTAQLDALIEHKWPDHKVPDGNDPLSLVIENIKSQSNYASSTTQVRNKMKKKVDYNINSRDSRLKTVITIGRKLRKEGH